MSSAQCALFTAKSQILLRNSEWTVKKGQKRVKKKKELKKQNMCLENANVLPKRTLNNEEAKKLQLVALWA